MSPIAEAVRINLGRFRCTLCKLDIDWLNALLDETGDQSNSFLQGECRVLFILFIGFDRCRLEKFVKWWAAS